MLYRYTMALNECSNCMNDDWQARNALDEIWNQWSRIDLTNIRSRNLFSEGFTHSRTLLASTTVSGKLKNSRWTQFSAHLAYCRYFWKIRWICFRNVFHARTFSEYGTQLMVYVWMSAMPAPLSYRPYGVLKMHMHTHSSTRNEFVSLWAANCLLNNNKLAESLPW